MLLTISTTHQSATDLGYLLHKHPGRFQTFPLSFGTAHVYYPESGDNRCTAALQVEVDPIRLVRRGRSSGSFSLAQYVNDRPYVASSFMSVAIGDVYGSALSGKSRERADLVDVPIPLEITLTAVRCRGGEALLHRLFDPLGYDRVELAHHPLDERFPEWGAGSYYTVTLATTATLRNLLRQLTVLIPVLDDDKHYWFGPEELEKLLHRGEGWLDAHPDKKLIVDRFLRYRRVLVREAIGRLAGSDGSDPDAQESPESTIEEAVERPISLHQERLKRVAAELHASGARRVIDMGCGEGRLIRELLEDRQFAEIVGVDVSPFALARAARRLHLDRFPTRDRVRLLTGALTYRDKRLAGYDAAALVEVIEHFDPPRLAAFERAVFEFARPKFVAVTTPNREYNSLFENLPPGGLRHPDHRFEWTRAEFAAWAEQVAGRFGYTVDVDGIGPLDPAAGQPSQIALFRLTDQQGPAGDTVATETE